MIIFGIKENNNYAGFSLTNDLQMEIDTYQNTPLTVVILGEAEDEIVARYLVDYFTYLHDPSNDRIDLNTFANTTVENYTLTTEGNLLLPEL
jgi:hypothetical protein